jgi:hypothetical protein
MNLIHPNKIINKLYTNQEYEMLLPEELKDYLNYL